MKKILLIISSLFLMASCINSQNSKKVKFNGPVYLDNNANIEDRVEDALSKMTLQEKIDLIHAQSKFSTPGVPRLGIPEIWCSDGPHGIRAQVYWDEWDQAGWTNDSCTAFPALTCLAATWNEDMSSLYGKSIGEEARYREKTVLLGPGVNIYRTPLNGRNFEYMGEDPYLSSTMVVPYIEGVQSNHVAACVKHFALNNQEEYRSETNVTVSDRALYEIYLPAFKAAVQKANVWAIMGSYNKYKNQFNCQNKYLLKDILRDEWNFDGAVISDWGGVHDTKQAAEHGLDLEFGTWTNGLTWSKSNAYDNYYLGQPYLKAIKKGELSVKDLEQKVKNDLRLIFRTTMSANRPYGSFNTPEHSAAGREIADEGIVLLKNENNTLPVDVKKYKNILIVGENATRSLCIGGGSSSLKVKYEISPLEGIKNMLRDMASHNSDFKDVKISYEKGYQHTKLLKSDNTIESKKSLDSRSALKLKNAAVEAAKKADYIIYIGGLNKDLNQDSEGQDRLTYDMPDGQNELISALSKVNKNLAVIILSGNGVAMPWVSDVPAIVEGWYGGSEAGNAIADVLFGKVNPSGKLPFTMPVKLEDNSAFALGDYPGDGENVDYKEGIFVGYRYADKYKVKPLFCFGHGLSYTTFKYGDIKLSSETLSEGDKMKVTIPITNIGSRQGKEVVQLYISDLECSVPRPVKELKGFVKLDLQPQETKIAEFEIDKSALSFFDANKHAWVVEPGKFEILIGSSSRDIRSKASFLEK